VSADQPTPEALAEEGGRARQMRAIVDLTTSVLHQGHLDRREAEALVCAARARILELFPDKEAVYELVLAPRFARLISEFAYRLPGPGPARVIPFPF
jgi:hypothetical protein